MSSLESNGIAFDRFSGEEVGSEDNFICSIYSGMTNLLVLAQHLTY